MCKHGLRSGLSASAGACLAVCFCLFWVQPRRCNDGRKRGQCPDRLLQFFARPRGSSSKKSNSLSIGRNTTCTDTVSYVPLSSKLGKDDSPEAVLPLVRRFSLLAPDGLPTKRAVGGGELVASRGVVNGDADVHTTRAAVTNAVLQMQQELQSELHEEQLQLLSVLGRGGFGTVYRGALLRSSPTDCLPHFSL
jgi:hypothetical protein